MAKKSKEDIAKEVKFQDALDNLDHFARVLEGQRQASKAKRLRNTIKGLNDWFVQA